MSHFIYNKAALKNNLSSLQLPLELKKNLTVQGKLLKIHKNSATIEFLPFQLHENFSHGDFIRTKEHIFYEKAFLNEGNFFSFFFRGKNSFFEELEFSKKKEKEENLTKFSSLFARREWLRQSKTKKFLLKNRILARQKNNFSIYFVNQRASLRVKQKKVLSSSLKKAKSISWFGYLAKFRSKRWQVFRTSSSAGFVHTNLFYYNRNQKFKTVGSFEQFLATKKTLS